MVNVENEVGFSYVMRGNMDLANVTLVSDDDKNVMFVGLVENEVGFSYAMRGNMDLANVTLVSDVDD